MLANRLHLRQGAAPSNFPAALSSDNSDLAQQITRDPYILDFVRPESGYRDADLQASLLADLGRLLLELGIGFAIVGEQYPLVVGDSEFFVDLLSHHNRLHRYVPIELKVGRFDPRDLSQLQFTSRPSTGEIRDPEIDPPPLASCSSPTPTRPSCNTRCSPPPHRGPSAATNCPKTSAGSCVTTTSLTTTCPMKRCPALLPSTGSVSCSPSPADSSRSSRNS